MDDTKASEGMRLLGERLVEAAERSDQRRLAVLHGSRAGTLAAASGLLAGARIPPPERTLVSPTPTDDVEGEQIEPQHAAHLLGTTRRALVLDAHAGLRPNVLGRTVGTVAGGGLYIFCIPPLDRWINGRDGFDEHLAVHPYGPEDVGTRLRERLRATLETHDGIAIVDTDAGRIHRDGSTDEQVAPDRPSPRPPPGARFPDQVYEACLTSDQVDAVHALEALAEGAGAVVIEADRGRGKSSAAGLAAGALALEGHDVLVTAPSFSNAREVLTRASELVDPGPTGGSGGRKSRDDERVVHAPSGGRVRFQPVPEALDQLDTVDAIVVDEAAALPVRVLDTLLEGPAPVAYVTTIHGYEGAGRGFSVRFKAHLEASSRQVRQLELSEPIRYAPGDPMERWANHALLLDARPAVSSLVTEADPSRVRYRAIDQDELARDEPLLREVFGLLVFAHYRTSPDDLARLLDAPDLACHALTVDGHVASVALVAEEGGLPEHLRHRMHHGAHGRVPGHLIPNVLTSQLRDQHAGIPQGERVVRIATHHAVRSRGLGTHLLDAIETRSEADWLGASFGATPELLRFWGTSGYHALHLSTSRNASSGEHSAILLRGLTPEGEQLIERQTRWMLERIGPQLVDGLTHVDPDVVRATLATIEEPVELALSEPAWLLVAASAFGPGLYDVNPGPFRRLALKHLVEAPGSIPERRERLLVRKVLQAHPWDTVVDELGFASRREAMLALGESYQPLVERYGGEVARDESARYE